MKSLQNRWPKTDAKGVPIAFLSINPEARVDENGEKSSQNLGGSLAAAREEKARPCFWRCSVAAGRGEKGILSSGNVGRRRGGMTGPRVAQLLDEHETLQDFLGNLGESRFCRVSEVGTFGGIRKAKSRAKFTKIKTLPALARVPFLKGEGAEARMSEYSAPVQSRESLPEKMQKGCRFQGENGTAMERAK